MSEAEEIFWEAWWSRRWPSDIVREHMFHPTRKWRFDFAFPSVKLAVEIEGWGRHQRRVGFSLDCEKYNTAESMGWRILRFPAGRVYDDYEEIIDEIQRVLCGCPID